MRIQKGPVRLSGLLLVAALMAVGALVGGGVAGGQDRATTTFTVSSSIKEGQTLSGHLRWDATVGGVSTTNIARVEFSIDSTLKWTEHSAPYRFNGDPDGLLDTNPLSNGNHAFTVRAVGTDGQVASVTATAKVQNPAATAPQNTAPPTISGEPRRGKTLSATSGVWTGTTPLAFMYRWLRCNSVGGSCSQISGATAQGYTLVNGDTGHRLRVTVRATNSAGASEATSESTSVVIVGVAPVNTVAPRITGTSQEGQTVSIDRGTWTSDLPLTFTYQWERCNREGAGCSAINAATGDRYTLGGSDVHARLSVVVTAANEAGRTPARSAPTEVVTAAGAIKLPSGEYSIPAVSVPVTERLVIDRISSQPTAGGVLARVHIGDTRGYAVRDALVYVLGLPYGWIRTLPEQTTGVDGTVTFTLRPNATIPKNTRQIVLFVRVRRQGDNLLTGVSTRRLVQVGLRPTLR